MPVLRALALIVPVVAPLVTLGLSLGVLPARAEPWPTRPVRAIVPFPAGG